MGCVELSFSMSAQFCDGKTAFTSWKNRHTAKASGNRHKNMFLAWDCYSHNLLYSRRCMVVCCLRWLLPKTHHWLRSPIVIVHLLRCCLNMRRQTSMVVKYDPNYSSFVTEQPSNEMSNNNNMKQHETTYSQRATI